MLALPDVGGWVKLHRGLLLSPVWQNGIAYRVYSSMYLRTAHRDRMETAPAMALKLLAGQLLTSQAEICELTGCTRKAVRSALEFLARQNAVTLCEQCGKVGSIYAVHSFPFMERGGTGASPRPEYGPEYGPGETGSAGQVQKYQNRLCGNGFSFSGALAGTESTRQSRPESGPEKGPGFINKDEEDKKQRIIPLPPFEKGAEDSSLSDSTLSVLRMWRETCEAAGVGHIEDKRTVRGAEAIARELLDPGKADADTIRRGMKNLLAMKAAEPKAKLYNLGTLCRSLSNFITAEPPGDVGNRGFAGETVYEWHTLHCARCNTQHFRKLPVNRPDKPVPATMACFTKNCDGVMTVYKGAVHLGERA